jgi:hypothetical protein
MTVRSDDASADREALERLLDRYLAAPPSARWIHRAILEDAMRPGGARSIRRGDFVVEFDGSHVAVRAIPGRFEDWGVGLEDAP